MASVAHRARKRDSKTPAKSNGAVATAPKSTALDRNGNPIYLGAVVMETSGSDMGGLVVGVSGDQVAYRYDDGAMFTMQGRELVIVTSAVNHADGINPGALVIVDGPMLAQVMARYGNAVILAPLNTCNNGGTLDPSNPQSWAAEDCSLVPPLPFCPPLHVGKAVRR